MSIQTLLNAAVKTALEAHVPLAGGVTAIFDAPPVRCALPYALVDEAVLVDWGAKGMAGREGRIAIRIVDGGERPVRLRALAGAAEDAIDAMPRAIGEGWAVASLILLRSRIVRDRAGQWTSMSEFRVRMLRSGG